MRYDDASGPINRAIDAKASEVFLNKLVLAEYTMFRSASSKTRAEVAGRRPQSSIHNMYEYRPIDGLVRRRLLPNPHGAWPSFTMSPIS